nr:hypothetical protein [Anaerolineae bacterium]
MPDVIFERSRLEVEGETFHTARLGGRDVILVTFDPDAEPGRRLALRGEETALTLEGRRVGARICPADYDNLLAFDRQVVPQRRLVALNKEANLWSGLGAGNRVIVTAADTATLADPAALGVFAGIFRAVAEAGVPNWFIQQSIVRELIPEGVDPAAHPDIGHTGGYGPRELLRSGLFAFASLGGYSRFPNLIGADADHAIVTGRDEVGLAASLALNKMAIAEARNYTKFTVDTCHLFDFPVALSAKERARLWGVFKRRTFAIPNVLEGHEGYTYTFDEEEVLRLGHKYWRACQVHKELYDFVADLKGDEPFDYELSLDETPAPTPPRELLFYLVVLEEVMGLPRGGVTSVAPSLGFRKRTDYEGDPRRDLWPHVNESASVAAAFGQVLCVHSGSGAGVETGKGPGVDQALAEATGGRLQLKVSGIYQEILWRVLAGSPVPAERALFEEAWERTRRVVTVVAGKEQAGTDEAWVLEAVQGYGPHQRWLAQTLLPRTNRAHRRPDDDFFRHFAYLVWRPLRARIYAMLTRQTWKRYTEAVA